MGRFCGEKCPIALLSRIDDLLDTHTTQSKSKTNSFLPEDFRFLAHSENPRLAPLEY
jgi:hypothetical protein